MGPFDPVSRNGNRYVAIAVDAFSKYVEAEGNPLEISTKKLYIIWNYSMQNYTSCTIVHELEISL